MFNQNDGCETNLPRHDCLISTIIQVYMTVTIILTYLTNSDNYCTCYCHT